MNKLLLILSLILSCIFSYSGQTNAAGKKPLPLVKNSSGAIEGKNALRTKKSIKSENKIFKPFAVNIEGSRAMTKFVTPGGSPGKNDTFVFQAYNPMDLFVSGKIYSLKNRLVATMQNIDKDNDTYTDMEWNPNSGSQRAKGGVYIYQIIIGRKVYKGTVIVIR